MKKLFSIILIIMVIGLVSCAKPKTEEKLEGSLQEILQRIYSSTTLNEEFRNNFVPDLVTEQVTSSNVGYHLGKSDFQFKEAIASEHTFSTVAYALVLVRVNEGTDIEQFKTDIKENVNPRKWICVGVDPNNVLVESIGDVIILIMTNNDPLALRAAFFSLKK